MVAQWSESEERAIRLAPSDGVTARQLATQLGRGIDAIYARASLLGVSLPRARRRGGGGAARSAPVPRRVVLRPRARRAWTSAEIEAVRAAAREGKSQRATGAQLGRSEGAVRVLCFKRRIVFASIDKLRESG